MQPNFNPLYMSVATAPSPKSHRSLQELHTYNSPRSHSLIQEPEVAYFYYNAEESTQHSLELRLTRLFKNLPYSPKLKNQSTPEAASPLRKRFPRDLKICFEIYDDNPASMDFNFETRRLFWETLPYINFIEISGFQGLMLFYNMMQHIGHSAVEEMIRGSCFRLLIRTPLKHEESLQLAEFFRTNLSINPNLIKEIAFENQSLEGSDWCHILSSLEPQNASTSPLHKNGKIILANCNWTQLVRQDDAVIVYNADLTMGSKLSNFIDELPVWVTELDIRSSIVDISSLIKQPSFIESCQNYIQRVGQPLKITFFDACFSKLTPSDIELLIQLEVQNTFILNDIFTKISWSQLINYLWHLGSTEHYQMLLEKYSGNTVAELRSLPNDLELLSGFIQALPTSIHTLKIIMPSLHIKSILNCQSVIQTLKNRSMLMAEVSNFSLDMSETPKIQISIDNLYQIVEMSSFGVKLIGLAKHITPRLWAQYFLTLEDSHLHEHSVLGMELLSHESLQAIEVYSHDESVHFLEKIPLGNQVFALSDIAPKDSTKHQPEKLLRLLLKANLPPETLLCLEEIASHKFTAVNWNCRFSRTLHIAIRLWRYALNQECPLSLQPEYVTRMLSEAFNPLKPAPCYGLAQVSFDALPKIVIDSLSKVDITLIQYILAAFKQSLLNCADYNTQEILYPFALCESHDPSAYIFRQGVERQRQEIKNAAEKKADPIVLSNKSRRASPLQLVFTPK